MGAHVFTKPGQAMWVCPPDVTSIKVEVWGAGGGGGGGNPDHEGGAIGGGGGAGGHYSCQNSQTVVPGRSYYTFIGVGGAGGGYEQDGQGGQQTSFWGTGLSTIYGGGGGSGRADGGHGNYSYGQCSTPGENGYEGSDEHGGNGGYGGNGGAAGLGASSGAGGDGEFLGGGGGGGSPSGGNGGKGGNGRMIITYTEPGDPPAPPEIAAPPAPVSSPPVVLDPVTHAEQVFDAAQDVMQDHFDNIDTGNDTFEDFRDVVVGNIAAGMIAATEQRANDHVDPTYGDMYAGDYGVGYIPTQAPRQGQGINMHFPVPQPPPTYYAPSYGYNGAPTQGINTYFSTNPYSEGSYSSSYFYWGYGYGMGNTYSTAPYGQGNGSTITGNWPYYSGYGGYSLSFGWPY